MRQSVLWFAEMMERVLQANEGKGGWNTCEFHYLTNRLREELGEVQSEVDRFEAEPGYRTAEVLKKIQQEAVDVANFAMMIADNARRILAGTVPEPTDYRNMGGTVAAIRGTYGTPTCIIGIGRSREIARKEYAGDWQQRTGIEKESGKKDVILELRGRANNNYVSIRQVTNEFLPMPYSRAQALLDRMAQNYAAVEKALSDGLMEITSEPTEAELTEAIVREVCGPCKDADGSPDKNE